MGSAHRPAVAAVAAVALLLAGCGASGDEASTDTTEPVAVDRKATVTTESDRPEPERTTTTLEEEGRGDVPELSETPEVPTSMVTVTDPVNGAFTVDVPEGWDSIAYSNVEGQIARQVVNSVSPDGSTVLFVGDPKIPSYWNPATADEMTVRFAEMLDSMELATYVPAEQYVQNYVNEKFGALDDFTIEGSRRLTDREQSLWAQAQQQGLPLQDIQVAELRFSFTEEGATTSAAVTVGTMDNGAFWGVELSGVATSGDLDTFLPVVDQVAASRRIRPEFQATLNQRHQDTMALIDQRTREMTERHNANMQWIQDSANAHQARMQAIWASNDAQMASYYDRMASSDIGHRDFLNYINDERTVQSSSGTKHQVDDSYDRYWLNPSTGAYVGGDINFGESQIRELGLNPSDYEEVSIVRG